MLFVAREIYNYNSTAHKEGQMPVRSHLGVVRMVIPRNGGQCAYFWRPSLLGIVRRRKEHFMFSGMGGNNMLQVKEIMITGTKPVSSSTPVIEAAHQMRVTGSSALPVCDNGEFRGVVTERDIVAGIVAKAGDPVCQSVGSLLPTAQPAISPDSDIRKAINIMRDNNLRALAVAENGKLVGLLTLEALAWEGLAIAASVPSTARMDPWKKEEEG